MGKKMKIYVVNTKDLFNEYKNPTLSLSAKDIINNKKIKKERVRK